MIKWCSMLVPYYYGKSIIILDISYGTALENQTKSWTECSDFFYK